MNDINNDEPNQINFRIFKECRYLFEDTVHSNKLFFDSIIQNHECFIERQNKYNNQYTNKKRHIKIWLRRKPFVYLRRI